MVEPGLTILNIYHLTAPAEDFEVAIRALAERVRLEGHSGVLSYRFFVNPTTDIGRAVIDYANSAASIGHHDLVMGWPEMMALHKVARLEEITFLGPLTGEIQAWIDGSTLTAKLNHGNRIAAGFIR